MAKDLTTSAIDRQNILNNTVALPKIQEALDVTFYEFQGKYVITKQQVADFYDVDVRTITNCLSANEDEIRSNGYVLCKGNDLKEFKLRFAQEIDFPSKMTQLGLFDFRSFLNVGMLLTTSEKAKMVRSNDEISDIVDDINDKFQEWVDQEYFATLQSNPLLKAKSVNKILPHLAGKYDNNDKLALLVVDGFSYWQYIILKDYLRKARLLVEEDSTLAWMPSITMLSRQAIFRGCDPKQDYKQNPGNEKNLWYDYWKNQGFGNYQIQYLYDMDEFAINEGVRRLAIVTVEMDEKMHSSTDYRDLYSLTENWCGRILEKIKTVVDAGYMLYLTTDHGSVLSRGWRTLTQVEKVFLYKDGSRGARHLIYNNEEEQSRFYSENADLRMIKQDNWMSIRDDRCFAKENKVMITHGGSHFLEMVIPLIKIAKEL